MLGYFCDFDGAITAGEVAVQTGSNEQTVRVSISRVRRLGLVLDGSP